MQELQNEKRHIVVNESFCCGCSACEAVCAQHAITMKENEKGFILPSVDESKCVNCGLCTKVCNFTKEKVNDSNILSAFSLVVNEDEVLKKSTSGGAFTVLSDYVLKDGGAIVGSVMQNDFSVEHIIAENVADRNRMRGSKYVQSNTQGVFPKVKTMLQNGRKVLFSGTPCQCAALQSFLGKEYDNLIVVDFLCHGVPNNRLFKDHIAYLEQQYGKKIVAYSFRDKLYGWDSYNNVAVLNNGRQKSRWINQAYYKFFVRDFSLREACHHCPYRSTHRPADITIGDFWGIEKLTGIKNNKGVSLVLVHSQKGRDLLDNARCNCAIAEFPIAKISHHIALVPSKPNKNREQFWKLYETKGYEAIVSRYFSNSVKDRIFHEIRKLVKRWK